MKNLEFNMDQPSVDFLEYIKNKNVKDDLTYLHLDDLRVALLLQALNKAESKADSIIDKKVAATYKSAKAVKAAVSKIKDILR